MANKVAPELSDKLFTQLQSESLVMLHTIDAEHGHPTSNAITWIYAPDKTTSVKDAMFYGSRMIVQPEIEKTYDERAAEKLDNQVFSALKKV